MKKIILAFTILLSLNLSAQKKDNKTKKDTTETLKQIPDSLITITLNDLINFTQFIRKNYSIEQYETMKPEQWISELFIWKRRLINGK